VLNLFLSLVGIVVARYLSLGRNVWKALPINSDPPETVVVSGVGGNGASWYQSESGGKTGGGGFTG